MADMCHAPSRHPPQREGDQASTQSERTVWSPLQDLAGLSLRTQIAFC